MYVVVGGGLAGLSAAVRLRMAGHEVRVFEADDAVGGRARTVDTAGDPVERFPNYCSPSADALPPLGDTLPSLGDDLPPLDDALPSLGDRTVRYRGCTARYRDGVVHPFDAPWERLAYPGTGIADAVRLARLERRVRRLVGSGDAVSAVGDDGAPSRADLDATTAEAFVVDRASRATYEGYVEPELRAEFGDRAGDVSAVWLAGWLRSRAEHDRHGAAVGYVDGSMDRLVDALLGSIGVEAVETGVRVVGVDAEDGGSGSDDGVRVTVETPTGDRVVGCAGVVVAGDPSTLEAVTGVDSGVESVAETCALVTTDRPIVDSWRVIVEPGALSVGGDAPFGTLFAHTNLVSPERYGGDHLTYLVSRGGGPVGGADALQDRWLSALEDLFASFSREGVRSVRVARDPTAAVAAPPGERVPVDLAEAGVPGVAYAGPGTHVDPFGGSPSARVAAGVTAAEAVMRSEQGTDPGPDPEPTRRSEAETDAGTTAYPVPERDGSGFEWG